MARRISSMFSSKGGDDLPRSSSNPQLGSLIQSQSKPLPNNTSIKHSPHPSTELYLNPISSVGLDPPPTIPDAGMYARPVSRDGRPILRTDMAGSRQSSGSRPQTPNMLAVPNVSSPARDGSPNTGKLSKRKSWLHGKSDRSSFGGEPDVPNAQAWIAGLRELVPYELSPLLNGDKVTDLWFETGDVLVFLYPERLGKGPSFKVNSELFADSRALSYLAQQTHPSGMDGLPSVGLQLSGSLGALSLQDQFGESSYTQGNNMTETSGAYNPVQSQLKSIHLPLGLEGDYSTPGSIPTGDDLELVVLYRNFFSFLCGGALIATPRQNSLYTIFMGISSILKRLQYGNDKESSWGAVPWASFSRYTEELRLADVRSSREKNIEAILIGEAMKSWPLYVEGFSHAVGRLDEIKSINSPKYAKISPITANKLERSYMDLQQRLQVLRTKLDNFYFPSMFAGIANSQTATESKLIRFKAWKASFLDFRSYTIAMYKKKYGSWPPKASSKKNSFEESGLNRLLLREVYQDFTDLYDMLVDRKSMTTRSMDLMTSIADNAESGSNETIQHAVRYIESEYDRSTPPVMPPIPFDVPLLPAYGSSLNREHMLVKGSTVNSTKLKDNSLSDLLLGACNRESIKPSPWIQEFLDYERRTGQGKSVQELIDARCGQWLFMYAVLQALPMTVVDARDLQYTDGVEYLLCETPRGGRPWMKEDTSASRAWYNVASGGAVVSLPADQIDHSVEGIYRRSYCWTIANHWAAGLGHTAPSQAPPPSIATPIPTRPPYLTSHSRSAGPSPHGSPLLQPTAPFINSSGQQVPRVSSLNSLNSGLQEIAAPERQQRPTSTYNPNLTFDHILANKQIQQKSGKKGKK